MFEVHVLHSRHYKYLNRKYKNREKNKRYRDFKFQCCQIEIIFHNKNTDCTVQESRDLVNKAPF